MSNKAVADQSPEKAADEGLEEREDLAEVQSLAAELPLEAVIEAIVLAHGEPVSLESIRELTGCKAEALSQAIENLKERYLANNSGMELATVGGKIQLRTKPVCAPIVRAFIAVKPRRLSGQALETLAVVAYQQPVVKSEIERIRGVDVSPTLKTLMERNLVQIVGVQPTAGQPALYGTTEEFMKIFGLGSLAELPTLREFKALERDPGEMGAAQNDDEAEQTSGFDATGS